MKKRSLISTSLIIAILGSLFSGFATVASATTVRDLLAENFVVDSKTPQQLGRWDGYTATVTNGENNSRIIAYSGTSTGNHISLSIPQSAVNDNSSAKPYILHLSYRIQNDRTNPAYITHRMQYKQEGGSGAFCDIFVTDTSTFTMNQDTSKNITTFGTSTYNYLDPYDYKVDLYENLKTGAYQIYLNGVKWISAYDYSTAKNMFGSKSDTINEYRLRITGSANSSWAFNLVNPCYEIYSQDVLMDDVIAATAAGMSNYLNATAGEQVRPQIDGGDATKTGVSGTESALGGYTSYDISGASGKNLRWWDGTQAVNAKDLAFIKENATADKAWLHMGFKVSAATKLNFKFQVWKVWSGNTTQTTSELGELNLSANDRADWYFDLCDPSDNNCYAYKYINGVFQGKEKVGFDNDAKQIKNIYINKKDGNSFRMSNLVIEYFAEGVTPGDMFLGYDARTKTTYDYIYEISGIQSGTNVIGKMDGLCNITGNNSSGYTLTPNSINQTNGGFARQYLNYTVDTGIYQSTDDKVLVYTAYYTPSVVSANSMHQIGIRGNDGYKWFLKAKDGKFYDDTDNFLKPYSTSGSYRIDFIMNNKDYKYYWLLDGVCFDSGSLYSERRPIWQVTYTMRNVSDRMVLKNISATLYKKNYDLLSKTKPLLSTSWVYADTVSYSVAGSTANIQTSYIANTTNPANANTKVLYAVYNNAGQLLHYQTAGSSSNVNGSNLTTAVTIPTGGTTLKVFMWNMNLGSSVLSPIANVITKSLQ